LSLSQRGFAGGHGHGHDDHHDDHGHHEQHVEKAAPDHKFIDASNADKRFIAFNGLRATEPVKIVLENPYRHHNDLPLSQ
jgi:hypothetical protein